MIAAYTPVYIEYAHRTRLNENQALALTLVFEQAVNKLDPTCFDFQLYRSEDLPENFWLGEFKRGDQHLKVNGILV